MTQEYFTVLTAVGEAKLSNLAATGRALKLTEFAVGDGGGASYVPTPEQLRSSTSLVAEKFRGPISLLEYDESIPSQYYMEGYVPIDAGPFTVREAGWFDDDGVMIFATRYPPTEKTVPSQGAQVDLPLGTYVSIHQVDGGKIQILIDPSKVLATRQFVESRFDYIPVQGPMQALLSRKYIFMAAGEITLPDSGTITVIVDHSVAQGSQCLVKGKSGVTINTPKGIDSVVNLAISGRAFVFSKINGDWRVS